MAYIVMAYIVMPYIVMAIDRSVLRRLGEVGALGGVGVEVKEERSAAHAGVPRLRFALALGRIADYLEVIVDQRHLRPQLKHERVRLRGSILGIFGGDLFWAFFGGDLFWAFFGGDLFWDFFSARADGERRGLDRIGA